MIVNNALIFNILFIGIHTRILYKRSFRCCNSLWRIFSDAFVMELLSYKKKLNVIIEKSN
jgi:hypothetical protein